MFSAVNNINEEIDNDYADEDAADVGHFITFLFRICIVK